MRYKLYGIILRAVCASAGIMTVSAIVPLLAQERLSTPDTRFVIGGEDAAVSASPSNVQLLFDVMVTGPIASIPIWPGDKAKQRPAKRLPITAWMDARLNSVGVAANTITISQLAPFAPGDLAAANFSSVQTVVEGMKLDQLISGLRLQTGIDFPILPLQRFRDSHEYVIEPDFVAGFGISTPLNSQVDSPRIWTYDPSNAVLKAAYPQQTNAVTKKPYDNIAFVPADRTRFFSEWFLGVRLKTHHLHEFVDKTTNQKKIGDAEFPGIIDITVGQNQGVTGGVMTGTVFHVGAFYPIPVENKGSAFYLFGALDVFKASPTPEDLGSTALFLKAAPNAILTDGTVDIRAINPTKRDGWRFGIGVDVLTLFRGLKGSQRTSSDMICTATATDTVCVAVGISLESAANVRFKDQADASKFIDGQVSGDKKSAVFSASDWAMVAAGATYDVFVVDAGGKESATGLRKAFK